MFVGYCSQIGDLDIFAKRLGLFYNGREKIGSPFGLTLTIIYILASFFIFIYYTLSIIKKEELQVNDSTEYSSDVPYINLNNSDLFYFAFGVENAENASRFVDETIYRARAVYYYGKKNTSGGAFNTIEYRDLKIEKCKVEKFGKNYQHLFTEGEFDDSYCVSNFDLALTGGFIYDQFSCIRILIYPCHNTSSNNNHCKPQSEIDKVLAGGYFSILLKDIGLNPNNYSFPLISTYQNLYTNIGKSKYKDLFIIYGITEIQTDTSLFQEKIKTEKYLQFRKYEQSFYLREDSMYYENENKPIISVEFRLDDNIFIQKRTYTKISDILYIIGGYMQILNTIFSLISILSNRLIPQLKILNGIFNFNFKEKKITMKINSIKEFKSILLKKTFVLPSNKQLFNLTYKTPINNNIFRNSLKINNNRNSNNNMSKNSLIGLDNNGNNSSVMNNVLNQRKHNSLIVIKESINSNNNNSIIVVL